MARRILIVDDESIVRTTLARLLTDYEVEIASGGEEALAAIKSAAGFDLIVCDLAMPRVSGVDVFNAAVAVDPTLENRFVFLTGGVFNDRVQAFLAEHDCPIIEKPFALDTFHERISELIQRAV